MSTLPTFYGDREENLHHLLARELSESLINQTIVLYIFDASKIKRNLYGEVVGGAPSYKPPIILKCKATESDIELEWDGGKSRIGRGDLIVHFYLDHITEITARYSYFDLKRGYYVRYLDEYYKIHDDGSGKSEIARHLGGDRRFYRTIVCKKVTAAEFDRK